MFTYEDMATTLILVRGLPGSGKSTYAKGFPLFLHIETDLFRYQRDGTYLYDSSKNGELHQKCFEETQRHLVDGRSVIVSNTFLKNSHMQPYVRFAETNKIPLFIVEVRLCL